MGARVISQTAEKPLSLSDFDSRVATDAQFSHYIALYGVGREKSAHLSGQHLNAREEWKKIIIRARPRVEIGGRLHSEFKTHALPNLCNVRL